MKGKGIPEGGFVSMHTLKPLNFGFLSESSGVEDEDYFQGEFVAGQQIGDNYYVLEGFLKNGVRCWAAFDAGPMDSSETLITETLAGGNQWVGGGEIARYSLGTGELAEIAPKLSGQADVVAMFPKTVGAHPGFEASIAWINGHMKADQAFVGYLKGNGPKPSFINAIPKAGDDPTTYPELNEFFLPLAQLVMPVPKGVPAGLVPPGTTFVLGSGSGGFPFMFTGYVDVTAYEAQIGSAVQITAVHTDSGKTVIDFDLNGKPGQIVVDPADNLVQVTPSLG
jgi:hypothetical protein